MERFSEAGIFLVDKERGETSAKTLSRLKRALSLEKVGHSGTLDPFATGLLVCLSARATRCASFAEEGRKRYSGEIQLGRRTDTDDETGETLSESTEIPSIEQALAARSLFTGIIDQLPPQYSALKIEGKRAYQYAREGIEVTLARRKIEVFSFDLHAATTSSRVAFTIECSAGTYIRSIARDLGDYLGCGGCLASLRREASFPFSVRDAKTVEAISVSDMLPWEALFPSAKRVSFPLKVCKELQGGDQRGLVHYPFDGAYPGMIALYQGEGSELCSGIVQWQEHSCWKLVLALK